jgi:hypothetical protein
VCMCVRARVHACASIIANAPHYLGSDGPWIVLLQSRPLIDLPFDHGTEELCHLVTKWLQVVLI